MFYILYLFANDYEVCIYNDQQLQCVGALAFRAHDVTWLVVVCVCVCVCVCVFYDANAYNIYSQYIHIEKWRLLHALRAYGIEMIDVICTNWLKYEMFSI